ncbi:hypothetical protein SAMN05421858_0755 [Haladaptatus litoreus]|uniref:Uncharacterized protein n=1 Tax=Haladaptatus litoreus TaxID=553468 RepID=A0A1N6WJU5_9EURY|nr:hypothetical protein [Haladaptatus litoreus]SIQ90354.1 hypothetical protein SAMN05421858_0755 [Haladaptatus litoreus]
MTLHRRQLLSSIPPAVAFSGCSAFGSQSVELSNVSLINLDDSSHDIHVRIERKGETVHGQTIRSPGRQNWERNRIPRR